MLKQGARLGNNGRIQVPRGGCRIMGRRPANDGCARACCTGPLDSPPGRSSSSRAAGACWIVLALILGQVVVSAISYVFNTYFTKKLVQYGLLHQFVDMSIYFILAGVMGAAVYLIGTLGFASQLLLLISQIACGIVVYLLLSFLVRPEAFQEMTRLVAGRVQKK